MIFAVLESYINFPILEAHKIFISQMDTANLRRWIVI